MFDVALIAQAAKLISDCSARGFKLACAESCTGGLLVALLTEIPGSSSVVDRGFVTYSNEAKVELLGIPLDIVEKHGAVSEQTACAMALGALTRSAADLAVSITGIAGPGGGSELKPVGLVHIASAIRGKNLSHRRHVFQGNRSEVRLSAVAEALRMLEGQATFLS
jgi:nicotinamide-nucleotide amidase